MSGNHLGLSLGSLGVLGRSEGGQARQGSSGERVYMNVATGNLVVQDLDEQLAGRGGAYQSLRTYNSQGQLADGALHWSINGGRRTLTLTGAWGQAGSSVLRTERDGAQARHEWDAGRQAYVSTDGGGAYREIVREGTGYVWRDGAGRQEHYDAGDGSLRSSRDAQGHTTRYDYDSRGRLGTVTLPSGEKTHYVYDGQNLVQVRVETAEGRHGTRLYYRYDAQHRLTEAIVDLSPEDNDIADGQVYVTRYRYDGHSERLSGITQADGSSLAFTYVQEGDAYRIASVTDALGHTTRYAYQAGRTIVTDAVGQQTCYGYDAAGQLTDVAQGDSTVRYAYNARGDVVSITDGAGRTTVMRYDDNGNQVAQEDALGNLVERRYDQRNRLVSETLSQRNATGQTASHTTRHVYGEGDQVRFTISAQGRVTEYRYNAEGDQSAILRYAQEGAAGLFDLARQPAPDEAALAAWAAAQPAHQGTRTDLEYDARGQLMRQTSYAALDQAGQGVAAGASVLRYVYDQSGRLLQTIDGNGGTTVYGYDGLGREMVRDEQGQVTLTRYDAAGRTSSTVHANGLTTQRTYDAAGRLLTVSHSGAGQDLGTTRHTYDALGRLVMREDPSGARSWLFYDAQGNKAADLDAAGLLSEYRYDGAGQLTFSLSYATRIDTALLPHSGVPALETLRPARSPQDRLALRTYDAAGRPAKEINAHGAVTTLHYDAAGRLVRSTCHATLIDITHLGERPDDSAIMVASHAQDRSTRHFYDADGLRIATLDAAGYLSEWTYDSAGRQTQALRHGQAVAQRLHEGDLVALQAAVQEGGQTLERSIYNARGQVVGQVDALGYLTETIYDANGNVARRIRYAMAANAGNSLAALRPAPDAQDRSTSCRYDASNRLIEETDYQGNITRYRYDAMGNVVATTRAVGAPEAISRLAQYDLQGRKIAELSAQGAALLQEGMTAEQIERIWQEHGTRHSYDALGRTTASTDANGNRTSYVYDATGRLTHTINALGEVAETRYDAFGQIVGTTRYARRLDRQALAAGLSLSTLEAALSALRQDAGNSVHTYRYDSQGLLLAQQDAAGLQTHYSYNSFGETVREERIDGQRRVIHTSERDRRGLVTHTVQDAGGLHLTSRRQFDAWGRVIQSTDARGNVTGHQYDRLGRQIVLTDALGGRVMSTYDAFDRIVSHDDRGRLTRYRYDAAQRSSAVTTADGVTVTTTFNRHGQQQEVTDGRGHVTRFRYDANGNLITQEHGGQTHTQRYDAANRLIETVDEAGRRTVLGYDAANRVIARTVDPDGLNLVTRYAYDGQGRQLSVTQPGGQVTQFSYDPAGRLVAQTVDPDGLALTTRHDYDASGQVLRTTQPNGNVTRYTYDNAGRRIEETIDPDRLKLTRRYRYDDAGNLTYVTDASGNLTRYAYDANNRQVLTIDPLGAVQRNVYDGASGRVAGVIRYARSIDARQLASARTLADLDALVQADAADLRQWTRYDAQGRIHQQIDASGAVTRFDYDANGNVTGKTRYATLLTAQQRQALSDGGAIDIGRHADDLVERSVYDSRNRLRYSIDALGNVTEQRYDAAGQLSERIAYARPVAADAGDDEAALAGKLQASGEDRHTRYVHDMAGRLRYEVDAQGSVTERRYDANGNLQQQIGYARSLHAGPGPLTEAAMAAALQPNAADRSVTTLYDAANRAQYSTDALGYVTHHSHDANGNIIKTVRHAQAASVVRDADGKLQLQALVASAQDRTEYRHYDAAGRLRFKIDGLGHVEETRYDAAGRITDLVTYREALADSVDRGDQVAIMQALANRQIHVSRYTYDAAGNLIQSTDALGHSETSTYDTHGRRISFTNKLGGTTWYAYDALGRLVSETLPVQAPGRDGLAQAIVNRFGYDAFGNRTVTIEAAGLAEQRITRYTFDAAGRPLNRISQSTRIYVAGQGWQEVAPTETTRYDSFGNLIAKTDANGHTTRYYYDAANRVIGEVGPTGAYIARQYDAAGNMTVQRSYVDLIDLPAGDTLPVPVNENRYRELRFTYDANGQLLETLQAQVGYAELDSSTGNFLYQTGDIVTRTAYNGLGQAVMNQDAQGRRSYLYYDVLGRKILAIDVAGYAIGWQYDAAGNVLRQHAYAQRLDPANPWSESSDAQDLQARLAADARDRITGFEYDALGRQTAEIRRNAGNASVQANGQLTEQSGDAVTRSSYNANGDLMAKTDAIGNTTQWEYDLQGRKTATLLPTATDHTGQAIRQTTRYQYNGLHLLTQETVEGSGADVARITRHAYDAAGRRVSQTLANGEVIRYGYDAQGNTTAEIIDRRQADGSVLHEMTSIAYDGAHREIRR
ncbi:hypothetical protein [Herbaspirillum sp. SJZ099]|uniref:hypothetical protein n=1 Tax=Herbaspirillum sp. SJZ099 TaxID=2572916 RepID=UPI001645EB7C|nr:hypothetical protein [Herbaspirillum sp. SJZ099]